METTEITKREREFFEKFRALCEEYNVSLYGEAVELGDYMEASDVPQSFRFTIDGRRFEEVRVNDPNDWGHPPRKVVTLVQLDGCFDLLLHERKQSM